MAYVAAGASPVQFCMESDVVYVAAGASPTPPVVWLDFEPAAREPNCLVRRNN